MEALARPGPPAPEKVRDSSTPRLWKEGPRETWAGIPGAQGTPREGDLGRDGKWSPSGLNERLRGLLGFGGDKDSAEAETLSGAELEDAASTGRVCQPGLRAPLATRWVKRKREEKA